QVLVLGLGPFHMHLSIDDEEGNLAPCQARVTPQSRDVADTGAMTRGRPAENCAALIGVVHFTGSLAMKQLFLAADCSCRKRRICSCSDSASRIALPRSPPMLFAFVAVLMATKSS